MRTFTLRAYGVVVAIGIVTYGCLFNSKPSPIPLPTMIVLEASQLPATVKIGIDPPTDGAQNYSTTLDGGAPVDQGLPVVTPACADFFSGATAPCLIFVFTVPTAGVHTITITAQSAGGNSASASYTFNLSVPAPAAHSRAIK